MYQDVHPIVRRPLPSDLNASVSRDLTDLVIVYDRYQTAIPPNSARPLHQLVLCASRARTG